MNDSLAMYQASLQTKVMEIIELNNKVAYYEEMVNTLALSGTFVRKYGEETTGLNPEVEKVFDDVNHLLQK
jgi:hypothetical protein